MARNRLLESSLPRLRHSSLRQQRGEGALSIANRMADDALDIAFRQETQEIDALRATLASVEKAIMGMFAARATLHRRRAPRRRTAGP
jgi:hypothetical protein